MYFVDAEGGQATLIVTPSKESILVDTGWPGFNGRDAGRIKAAAKSAGVKQIDYLVLTHYHTDHAGGVSQLARKNTGEDLCRSRTQSRNRQVGGRIVGVLGQGGRHRQTSGGQAGRQASSEGCGCPSCHGGWRCDRITRQRGGASNHSAEQTFPEDKTENARSTGLLITYGKFRMLDLGDLTSQKEMDLVCPQNRLGKIDLYLTTHHGTRFIERPGIVHALAPRVAIMNNGAKKGGSADAWKTVRSSPGLEDFWQLHFAVAGGKETMSPTLSSPTSTKLAKASTSKLPRSPMVRSRF